MSYTEITNLYAIIVLHKQHFPGWGGMVGWVGSVIIKLKANLSLTGTGLPTETKLRDKLDLNWAKLSLSWDWVLLQFFVLTFFQK